LIKRGLLSFDGGGVNISAGRFRGWSDSDDCVPAVEGMSSIRADDFSGMSREEVRSMTGCQFEPGEAWAKRLCCLRKEPPTRAPPTLAANIVQSTGSDSLCLPYAQCFFPCQYPEDMRIPGSVLRQIRLA